MINFFLLREYQRLTYISCFKAMILNFNLVYVIDKVSDIQFLQTLVAYFILPDTGTYIVKMPN